MQLEVIGVSRAADGFSNDTVYAVQFGKIMQKTDPRYNAYAINGMNPTFITLTLFYKFEEAAPYRVGSKWNLQVSNDGTLKLEEEK